MAKGIIDVAPSLQRSIDRKTKLNIRMGIEDLPTLQLPNTTTKQN